MPFRVVFDPGAEGDLANLLGYIAEHSGEDRAYAFVRDIRTYCLGLDQFPERGTRRDDIRPGVRVVGYRRKVSIVFTVQGDIVNILGVYYRGRNSSADFRDED